MSTAVILAILLALTGSVTAQEVTVAIAGDIACDPDQPIPAGQCQDAATADLIASRQPVAVLVPGDIQYVNGSYSKYLRRYDLTWGRFKDITFPAPGNHEYLQAGGAGYYQYFGARAHPPHGYYAFDLNGWRIYAINNECAKVDCTVERDWMRADVQANRRTCQILMMHKPLYSSGTQETIAGRRFWNVAQNNRFELILQAHDHLYERFAPLDVNGQVSDRGVRSFIVGTGGKSLDRAGTPATGSQVRFHSDYGILFLKLSPTSYTFQFETITGNIIDAGSGTCRR